jgi:hypothetical protein
VAGDRGASVLSEGEFGGARLLEETNSHPETGNGLEELLPFERREEILPCYGRMLQILPLAPYGPVCCASIP